MARQEGEGGGEVRKSTTKQDVDFLETDAPTTKPNDFICGKKQSFKMVHFVDWNLDNQLFYANETLFSPFFFRVVLLFIK